MGGRYKEIHHLLYTTLPRISTCTQRLALQGTISKSLNEVHMPFFNRHIHPTGHESIRMILYFGLCGLSVFCFAHRHCCSGIPIQLELLPVGFHLDCGCYQYVPVAATRANSTLLDLGPVLYTTALASPLFHVNALVVLLPARN